MGDAKHTPGPWKAVEPTAIDYRSMQIQTDESLIAVCCGGGPKRAISAPEERANARLIAAAPDLVEAAKDALSGWRYIRSQHGDLYGVGWDRVENALVAALSKAGV